MGAGYSVPFTLKEYFLLLNSSCSKFNWRESVSTHEVFHLSFSFLGLSEGLDTKINPAATLQ